MKFASQVFECGIHERIQYAQNEAGRWFRRHQFRSPYGYKWTSWKGAIGKPEGTFRNELVKVRLPK